MILKPIHVKFPGHCSQCKAEIPAGELAMWAPGIKKIFHVGACSETAGLLANVTEGIPIGAKPKTASLKPSTKKTLGTTPIDQNKAYAAVMGPVVPVTQKAKGIVALQSAGMLSKAMALVAQTEEQAVSHAHTVSLPCFVRPCPVTPRHGFVDSRVVKTDEEVRGVWREAREADPQAECLVMPFVKASHNMVWRPGLLSIGPGHDGATAGHDSVSVFLQGEYSQSWKTLSTKAGVDLAKSDPFIEAVSSPSAEIVVTQIRGGVKGCPTAPDWCPYDQIVVERVVTIDPATKNEPGKMLAWETDCLKLDPKTDVVYNPGGNLGDHWSVHAQLAGVSVVTSYKPQIGQTLEKCGEELIPLEPQAIVFGFLGGILAPDLSGSLIARKQAVCAAVLGTHHGLRMGGDAGIFLGASCAFMLRLGQAALWGEARHAEHTGLSRDQIYKSILNDWIVGRAGLKSKVALFWTHKWGGGFGGQAWAACAQGLVDLDTSILNLVRVPSRVNAKKCLAALTNVVNLAHNNGWWLNKFVEKSWFDLAADLDPRVALMAGPVWYESTLDGPDRMGLYAQVEQMTPIDLSDVDKGKTVQGKKLKGKPKAETLATPEPIGMGGSGYTSAKVVKKQGSFPDVGYRSTVVIPGKQIGTLVGAQIKDGHCQLQIGAFGEYLSGGVTDISDAATEAIQALPTVPSLSGSGAIYHKLSVAIDKDDTASIWIADIVRLFTIQKGA